ncbi:MAG TPA: hypothetical protein VFF28_03890 [Candidatus Nanoarchaeia archaeon]|nr:hypothetical protein [Candidatus Nanoarchaeia archaeon]
MIPDLNDFTDKCMDLCARIGSRLSVGQKKIIGAANSSLQVCAGRESEVNLETLSAVCGQLSSATVLSSTGFDADKLPTNKEIYSYLTTDNKTAFRPKLQAYIALSGAYDDNELWCDSLYSRIVSSSRWIDPLSAQQRTVIASLIPKCFLNGETERYQSALDVPLLLEVCEEGRNAVAIMNRLSALVPDDSDGWLTDEMAISAIKGRQKTRPILGKGHVYKKLVLDYLERKNGYSPDKAETYVPNKTYMPI